MLFYSNYGSGEPNYMNTSNYRGDFLDIPRYEAKSVRPNFSYVDMVNSLPDVYTKTQEFLPQMDSLRRRNYDQMMDIIADGNIPINELERRTDCGLKVVHACADDTHRFMKDFRDDVSIPACILVGILGACFFGACLL